MNEFKKRYGQYMVEAKVQHKLENFEQVLQDNPDLALALELCSKIEALEKGAEALVVGGSVRDIILGKKPKDIDIATNVEINAIEAVFRTVDIGKSKDFGIVAILYKDKTFEVAHYREDVFEGETNFRHPTSVKKTKSFELDSARRDITINSLGLKPDGTVVDYQGGLEDLKNGIIRAVGKPKDRFIEDSLRMMRVGRFMSRYGFKLDDDTKNAITELKHLISKIAPERIRDEIFKAASNGASLATYIEHLKEVGLLQLILPEISKFETLEQMPSSHPEGDVFKHTMAALRASKSNDAIVNIAVLFHDLGKLVTKKYEDGRVNYRGHEGESRRVFDTIANRLKLSNEEREAILFAAENHMIGHRMGELKKSRLLALRQNKNWEVLKHTIWADEASRGSKLFDPKEYEERMNKAETLAHQFGQKQDFEKKIAGFVNGQLIMVLVPGIKGPDIGTVKNQTREWIIQNDFNVDPKGVKQYIQDRASELGYKV